MFVWDIVLHDAAPGPWQSRRLAALASPGAQQTNMFKVGVET